MKTKNYEHEELIPECIEVIRSEQKASVSLLQRRLRLGYIRAASIMDELEKREWSGLTLRMSYRRPRSVNREAELKALSAVSRFEIKVMQAQRLNQVVIETFGRKFKPIGVDCMIRNLRKKLVTRWIV